MPNTEKVERVEALKHRIEDASALLLADFRGLSVHDAGELRNELRESGTRFMIVKNTLMKRAADEQGMEDLASLLQGPTGVAFVAGDAVAAAKKITEAAKKFPALVLKGGWMDGRLLTADDAEALSKLESREAMLSKIAGLMKGEMSRAANMFVSLQGQFLSLLEAYKDKLPGEAAPASEEPTDSSEEAIPSGQASSPESADSEVAEAPAAEAEAPATEAEADAGAEVAEDSVEEMASEPEDGPSEEESGAEGVSSEESSATPKASEGSDDEAQASGEGEE